MADLPESNGGDMGMIMRTGRHTAAARKIVLLFFVFLLSYCTISFGQEQTKPDYSRQENWAYAELTREDASVDVFFIAPTTFHADGEVLNMPMDDEAEKKKVQNAIAMEKGIYDDDARFFAPYYSQIALELYGKPDEERLPYLSIAYTDIRAAFDCYFQNYNNGRPIILAGFSQGAEHCIHLMKDYFQEELYADQLVACYAIGWRYTDADQKEAPGLQFASGETDTGCIIAFNSEADFIDSSAIIPAGIKTLAINPLNWKTDSTAAERTLNLGACFMDGQGEITEEIPDFTGAYIDPTRGALKVTDVDPAKYPAKLSIFPDGVYHIYDYMFFYRNLEKNVLDRIAAFTEQTKE